MKKTFFIVIFFTLASLFNVVQAQLAAKGESVAITPGVKTMIDVLANDNLGACSEADIATSMVIVTNPDPSKGAVVKESGAFYYTPKLTASGTDSFSYKISCGGQTSTATVNIQMGTFPGNILPDQCSRNPGKFSFSMKEIARTTVATSNYFPAIIGDLNRDGVSEIIIPAIDGCVHPYYSKVYILNFDAGTKKVNVRKTITLPTGTRLSTNNCSFIGDFDNDGYGEIAIPAADGTPKLVIYKHDATVLAEIGVTGGMATTTGMADFNRDGYPEIYIGTRVFRYNSNKTITQLIAGNPALNAVAQDVNNDGNLELVTANAVYSVNLTTNTLSTLSTCTAGMGAGDRFAVADIDLDGNIDVVTLSYDGGTGAGKRITVRVWNPITGALKYSVQTNAITVASSPTGRGMSTSWPFIGDTDSNHYPDIIFMGGSNETSKTYVYRVEYESGALKIRKQDNNFKDYSSRITSMSMFDFNNDRANEIVYRDEDNLYILDGGNEGVGGNPLLFKKIKTMTNCLSGTGWEYPVVTSLTSTGESYVIMNSGVSTTNYWIGTLRIYGADLGVAGAKPWAQSRKVWNQFAFYQNTIDDNLKAIQYPLPLNYKMVSSDGLSNLYPLNGHMMQRGIINVNTLEFFTPISDLVVTSVNYDHNTVTDVMTIRVAVTNEGDAGIDPPIPVRVYVTVGGSRTLKATKNITEAIAVGQTKNISIDLDSYSTFGSVEKIDVEIVIPSGQYDCRPGNNTDEKVPNLKAVADVANTNVNQNVTIPVITNDNLGSCNTTNIVVSVVGTPTKGSATPSGKQIVYTPMADNIGGATFNYKITCDGNTSTAKVSIGTESKIKAEFVKNAEEPGIAGEIRLRFNEINAKCDYPVKVTYKVTSPVGLVNGTHYTVSPASPATIAKGYSNVVIKVTPIDNYIVESTRGDIKIEVTGVEMVTTP